MQERARELLVRVRARLARPFGWTQRASARTWWGGKTRPKDPEAYSFCLIGALLKEERDSASHDEAVRALVQRLGGRNQLFKDCDTANLVEWNDVRWRKKRDVLQLIDDTLEVA